MEKIWMDKKVYVITISGRNYQGKVVAEDETKIVLIDIKNHLVEISKSDIKLCQEEEWTGNVLTVLENMNQQIM